MRKIIILLLLIISTFVLLGCEGLDLSQVSDKDLSRIADKAIVCNEPYIRFETGCCLDQNLNNVCDEDEGIGVPEGLERPVPGARDDSEDQALPIRPNEPEELEDDSSEDGGLDDSNADDSPTVCVPKGECVYQDYAGGIKECGLIDDGCGGTINCNYQPYAGGVECPDSLVCVDNQCKDEGYTEASLGVQYRLFAEDRAKIGYHLQFFDPTGASNAVGAAFGIMEVVDGEHLVLELTGDGYEDTLVDAALGETIELTTEGGTTYSILIDDITNMTGRGIVDVSITSSDSVNSRLFATDSAKIGYLLQFYDHVGISTGVGAAFGIKEVTDADNLVLELSGEGYDDTFVDASVGDTIDLTTEGGDEYDILIDHITYIPDNPAVDIVVTRVS